MAFSSRRVYHAIINDGPALPRYGDTGRFIERALTE